MLVQVESRGGVRSAAVLEAGDLRQLKVTLSQIAEDEAAMVLAQAQLGSLANGFAWLSVDALRSAAMNALKNSPDAGRQFDAMIDYAAKHDWLSEDGRHVRAHCEVSPPVQSDE